MLFFELEGGYLVIGAFFLAITAFVTTRDFVGGGKAWKKGIPIVFVVMMSFIVAHYVVTTNRMEKVEKRFMDNKPVICENRANRRAAQSIIIDPSKPQGWSLQDHIFSSDQFERQFHSARCLEYFEPSK